MHIVFLRLRAPPPWSISGRRGDLLDDLDALHGVVGGDLAQAAEAARERLERERERPLLDAQVRREELARAGIASQLQGGARGGADEDGHHPVVDGPQPLVARDLRDGLEGVAVRRLCSRVDDLVLHPGLGEVDREDQEGGDASGRGADEEVLRSRCCIKKGF